VRRPRTLPKIAFGLALCFARAAAAQALPVTPSDTPPPAAPSNSPVTPTDPAPSPAAPTASPSAPAASAPAPPDDPPDAKLVEELMASASDADDLAWLYSHQDEYTPSELTGKPVDVPALPSRGEGSPRTWDPRFRRFGLSDYLLTGGAILVAGGANLIPAKPNRWTGRNATDEWVRRNLSATRYEASRWARDVSDLLVSVNVSFPLLFDSLIVTYWYRRSPEVAAEIALISSEAIAVGAALQVVTSGLASRERPYSRKCGRGIDERHSDCVSSNRYRSFFSGHTTNAFAGAGATCTAHMHHAVFGSALADGLACGMAFLSAGTVGAMRIVGQKHYLTDVLTGAGVGTLVGLGTPWLLHYGPLARNDAAKPSQLSLSLVPMPNGLSLGGKF
jgi:membrane-associated phospholipid phosphatase